MSTTHAEPVTAGPALSPAPDSVSPPPRHWQLPVHTQPPAPPPPQAAPPRWWWLGAHGGAGVSTLARLVPGGGDALRAWPNPELPAAASVVLVCRSNQHGMTAAAHAVRQWLAGACPPVALWGVVIVADAPGRLPRALTAQRRRLAGTVPRTHVVPWVDQWRAHEPAAETAPKALARLGTDLASGPWVSPQTQKETA